jgi:hypothetical protein
MRRKSRAAIAGAHAHMRKLVEDEFRRGASMPVIPFPRDGAEIPDTPRLTLVVADPEGAGSQNVVTPVIISPISRPVTGPSVGPEWPWP